MQNSGWHYYNRAMIPNCYPHEQPDLSAVKDGSLFRANPKAFFARWTTDWDCGYDTGFYGCMLDQPLAIETLKAKRRYEITLGCRNFEWRKLEFEDIPQMYAVYLGCLSGYKGKQTVPSKESFAAKWEHSFREPGTALIGVFRRSDGVLCGFAHLLITEDIFRFPASRRWSARRKTASIMR